MSTGYARTNFGLAGQVAAPAAGANSGLITVVTPDDNALRQLTGVMITDVTKGGHTQIFNGQKRVADIGHDAFATTNRWVTLDEPYQAGITFQFLTFNDSAGALAANPGIHFRYLVGESQAPQVFHGE